MYSLLYKDWNIIKKSRALLFGFFYFLFIIPTASKGAFFSNDHVASFFFLFIIYLFFSYVTAYDYKYNGLTLMSAFPVTKKTIVRARYLFFGLIFVIALALLVTVNLVAGVVKHEALSSTMIFDYGHFSVLFLVFALSFGIVIPLYYKLGYQKIRWVMFIAVMVSAVVSGFLTSEMSIFSNSTMSLIIFLFGVVIYWSSMKLSERFLEQRAL